MTTQTLEVFLDSIFYNIHLHDAVISYHKNVAPSIIKEYLDEKHAGWKRVGIHYGFKEPILIPNTTGMTKKLDNIFDKLIKTDQLCKYYLEVAFI